MAVRLLWGHRLSVLRTDDLAAISGVGVVAAVSEGSTLLLGWPGLQAGSVGVCFSLRRYNQLVHSLSDEGIVPERFEEGEWLVDGIGDVHLHVYEMLEKSLFQGFGQSEHPGC